MENKYLYRAFVEAQKAYKKNEIPVGCVIVKNNKIIAVAFNKKEKKKNGTMHAEIIAINKACKKMKTWYLNDCELYTTLEPCMMCIGAIVENRIKKIYYGCKNNNEQMYDINKVLKYVDMEYIKNDYCSNILTTFFKNKRKK